MGRESRALAARLESVGTPVATHFCPGTHDAPYWVREFRGSLPMLLRALHHPAGHDG